MGYKVAVVGASGNVGREILSILAEREFPADEVVALASARSAGREVSYGERDVLRIEDLAKYDFSGTDIVLSSPGASISKEFAPRAASAGSIVIDNTSYFRMELDIPLIVPEVNPEAIEGYRTRGIIANPNCSTIQMVLALKPLHDYASIRRIIVSTYQSTSGAGKEAMDELFNQTRGIYVNESASKHQTVFPKQIAFNAIPQIDDFMEDGFTKEEWKMDVETQKILGSDIKVSATCVRCGVFIGHGEAVNVEFDSEISVEKAWSLLRDQEGISLVDHRVEGGYVTPQEVAGEDNVFVSRVRRDETVEHGLSLWIVADNLRKGAALNTVQIAELLVDYLS